MYFSKIPNLAKFWIRIHKYLDPQHWFHASIFSTFWNNTHSVLLHLCLHPARKIYIFLHCLTITSFLAPFWDNPYFSCTLFLKQLETPPCFYCTLWTHFSIFLHFLASFLSGNIGISFSSMWTIERFSQLPNMFRVHIKHISPSDQLQYVSNIALHVQYTVYTYSTVYMLFFICLLKNTFDQWTGHWPDCAYFLKLQVFFTIMDA